MTGNVADGPVTFGHDANGNLISTTQNSQFAARYEYDVRDQLRLVKSGAQRQEVARYDYDYARRRTSKVLAGGVAEQRFVYNGAAVVDEYDDQNRLLNRYDYGAGLIRGEFSGEGERFYFNDGLGSTTSLSQISQSGQTSISSVTASYEYDAWGSVTRSGGGSYNAIGYTGQRQDAETGLLALGNGERYYAAGLGRFTQQDSLTGGAGQPQSLNRYAYALNSPLKYTDPTGHYANEGTLNRTQYGYTPPRTDITWGEMSHAAVNVGEGIGDVIGEPFRIAYDFQSLLETLIRSALTGRNEKLFSSHLIQGFVRDAKSGKPLTQVLGDTARQMAFGAVTFGFGPLIVEQAELAQRYARGELTTPQYDDASTLGWGHFLGNVVLIAAPAVLKFARAGRGVPRLTEESLVEPAVKGRSLIEGAVEEGFASINGIRESVIESSEHTVGNNSSAIASASEGSPGPLLSESSLTKRQACIHAALPESGATNVFPKRAVSMPDLRALGRVTGDEYLMYTSKGSRLVVRGYGNEVIVSPELASQLKLGGHGRWSGHTHPPGYSIEPSVTDRNFLPTGQRRSAIWGMKELSRSTERQGRTSNLK